VRTTHKFTTTARGLGHHWRRLRLAVLRRDGYRCHWCGGRAATVDHIVARVEGGARYDPRNLVASCTRCNLERGGRLGAARSAARRGVPPAAEEGRRVWAGAISIDG
jgi:5-methylcytosine-specific restriction endonuclease McrA